MILVSFFGIFLFTASGFLNPSKILRNHQISRTPKLYSENLQRNEAQKFDYSWDKQWYAVCYEDNLPVGSEVLSYSVFGKQFALWKDKEGKLNCVDDVCPHRLAKLSEGQVIDGNIECRYHGWQFDGAGECQLVPQLAEGASIPKRATVQAYEVRVCEKVVWLFPTPILDVPKLELPPVPSSSLELDKNGNKFFTYRFQTDLPYEHFTLIENLLDPAHVPIAHYGVGFSLPRSGAQPLNITVDKNSINAQGFTGSYGGTRGRKNQLKTRFEAPGFIEYAASFGKFTFGSNFICMPLSEGRSRLLTTFSFRLPNPVLQLIFKLKPIWMRNLESCKVLEQDVGVLCTQEDTLRERGHPPLKDAFFTISNSDEFVTTYRKWVDSVSAGMPWSYGWTSSNMPQQADRVKAELPPAQVDSHRAFNKLDTRYHRHVVHTRVTRDALRNVQRLIVGFKGLTALSALLGGARVLGLWGRVGPRLLLGTTSVAWLAVQGLKRLEKAFYVGFEERERLKGMKQ